MINVQVIDTTDSIKLTLINAEVNTFLCDDEVQALSAVEKMQPSVILLNYDVRKEKTIDYIGLIVNASSDSKIVVIGEDLSDEKILSCLVAGAKGYQNIKQLDEYINKLIRIVDAGEAWITRLMVAKLLENIRTCGEY